MGYHYILTVTSRRHLASPPAFSFLPSCGIAYHNPVVDHVYSSSRLVTYTAFTPDDHAKCGMRNLTRNRGPPCPQIPCRLWPGQLYKIPQQGKHHVETFLLGCRYRDAPVQQARRYATTDTPSDQERNSQDSLEYSMKLPSRPAAGPPLPQRWHEWVRGICWSSFLTRWWLGGRHAHGERRHGPEGCTHHVRLPGSQIAGPQSRVRVRRCCPGSGCS